MATTARLLGSVILIYFAAWRGERVAMAVVLALLVIQSELVGHAVRAFNRALGGVLGRRSRW